MKNFTEIEIKNFAEKNFIVFFSEKITKNFLKELDKKFLTQDLLMVNLKYNKNDLFNNDGYMNWLLELNPSVIYHKRVWKSIKYKNDIIIANFLFYYDNKYFTIS